MKLIKINTLIEYLSPTLILSYLFVHNIFYVLIGIIFSFYLININFINQIARSINKKIFIQKPDSVLTNNEKEKKPDLINIKPNEENTTVSLVDMIEELGFIPSPDKNKDDKAA